MTEDGVYQDPLAMQHTKYSVCSCSISNVMLKLSKTHMYLEEEVNGIWLISCAEHDISQIHLEISEYAQVTHLLSMFMMIVSLIKELKFNSAP